MNAKETVTSLLTQANITINGDAPHDIQVHNEKLYSRILRQGTLGLGESYMDGWWDAEKLDQFFYRVLKADLRSELSGDWRDLFLHATYALLNPQKKAKAFIIGERHYDVGNDLYQAMLDDNLTYTCGYWKEAGMLRRKHINNQTTRSSHRGQTI